MTDITPADLAKFIHPVPVGATIPAGMEFVRRYMNGTPTAAIAGPIVHDFDIEAAAFTPLWTAEPLAAPKPPLPTEVGAVIANVSWRLSADTCARMMLMAQSWVGIDQDGDLRHWFPGEITDWTPARVVTDEADR